MKIPSQKIGTCRSGKLIYTFSTYDRKIIEQQIASYISADHFDAWVVFERLTVRAMRRFGIFSGDYRGFFRYANNHEIR